MHDNDLGVVNCVNNPIVASARRVEAIEFPDQLLAESWWIFSHRPLQRGERRVTNFFGEALEVSKTFGRDSHFIHEVGPFLLRVG
jgi:hypothetical protein